MKLSSAARKQAPHNATSRSSQSLVAIATEENGLGIGEGADGTHSERDAAVPA